MENIRIKVLDCTLRDGGYMNNWKFSNEQIHKIIDALVSSNVDIIECGYLDDKKGTSFDSTLFESINVFDNLLNKRNEAIECQKVLMINYGDYDVKKLISKSKTSIDGIRLAFHKDKLDEVLVVGAKIIELGYKLYFQPMVTKNYSDLEFLSMIKKVNKLKPYAFYIVDSFGSMTLDEFNKYLVLVQSNLDKNIALGYHSHNNMQLAFSNAIDMCNANLKRDIFIDSSIYGIGRGAGNLNTELIIDYLNKEFQSNYNTLPLLEIIDEYLSSLMDQNPWGFSPAQFLSASYNCHPNYASFLINQNTNHIVSIQKILNKLPNDKKNSFNKDLIKKLYEEFILEPKTSLNEWAELDVNKHITLIASGSSVLKHKEEIKKYISDKNSITIGLNHKSDIECDYYFFTNQKRYDEFIEKIDYTKVVITNNIRTKINSHKVLDFANIAYINGKLVVNVALVCINLLRLKGVNTLSIAGMDGYAKGVVNYEYEETSYINDIDTLNEQNKLISENLNFFKTKIDINFLTQSIFDIRDKLKVIGVIPARFQSSRYEGKPLALINGIPMIKRTYEQAKKSKLLDELVVATEHEKIKNYCERENIPVIMTSDNCLTGTDRIAEVAQKKYFDLYVNIQGDEPVIDPKSIDEVITDYKIYKDKYLAYNLYKIIDDDTEINSNTIIKTIVNEKDELMYMSRLGVPFNKSNKKVQHKKQVCVYGFTKKALELFASRNKTLNEQFEDIEILRFIDMGYKVKMKETSVDSIAVDVPKDIKKVEEYLNQRGLK